MTTKPEKRIALDAVDGLPPRLLLPLALGQDKSPPTELRLFSAGVNLSTKGAFLFTEAAAKSVMAEYLVRGVEKSADYNHGSIPQTLKDGTVVQPDAERGKAAARYQLELRQGPVMDANGMPTAAMGPELWAVNIRWTDEAAGRIRAGEYFHNSNAFNFTPDGEVTKFINFALTNNPAMLGLAPLVAATDDPAAPERTKTMKLSDEIRTKLRALAGLADADFADQKEADAKLKECMSGLAPAAPKEDSPETCAALSALTGKTARGEQLAVLTALRDGATATTRIIAERDEAVAKLRRHELGQIIEKGKTDGKLSPAMLSDAALEAPTTSTGKYLKRLQTGGDVEALSAYVDALPKLVSTDATTAKPAESTAALSADEKHIDEIFNRGRPATTPAAPAPAK